MSISSLYNYLTRIEKDIADIQKKISEESRREVDKQKQIDFVNRSITRSTPVSSVQRKQSQIRGYQNELLNLQKKKADLFKKQQDLSQNQSRKRQEIAKEEQRERERINREQEAFQGKMLHEINSHRNILAQLKIETKEVIQPPDFISKKYDFFISHATEDKEDIVRPLALKLQEKGKEVWLDELIMIVGDSLRRKIDEGLKNSRFGIVVLSTNFFKKNWTQHELDGLVAREMNGIKVILPIWHKVTKDEVLNYSPSMADKLALNSSIQSLDEIVEELLKVLS